MEPTHEDPDALSPELEVEQWHEDARLMQIITGSEALAKACFDPFDYAMRLRTGEVVAFSDAKMLDREWVHITLKPVMDQPHPRIAYPAERGMDVRLSDIVWVMDAPEGS